MAEKLAVFDVDGTQFKSACVEKVIEAAIDEGLFKAEIFNVAFARRRLWQANNNEGVYRSYLYYLIGSFVSSIAGVSVEQFQAVTNQMVAEHSVRMFSYPRNLAHLLQRSHRLVAISGSPLVVVEPFLAGLGFDYIIGSTFEVEDGRFTGKAQSVDKRTALDEIAGVGGRISVGIGDTVGDIPVLERARCPIAFNPSATLRRKAIAQSWPIVLENKDAITQLLPEGAGYQVVFDRSPSIALERFDVEI